MVGGLHLRDLGVSIYMIEYSPRLTTPEALVHLIIPSVVVAAIVSPCILFIVSFDVFSFVTRCFAGMQARLGFTTSVGICIRSALCISPDL